MRKCIQINVLIQIIVLVERLILVLNLGVKFSHLIHVTNSSQKLFNSDKYPNLNYAASSFPPTTTHLTFKPSLIIKINRNVLEKLAIKCLATDKSLINDVTSRYSVLTIIYINIYSFDASS